MVVSEIPAAIIKQVTVLIPGISGTFWLPDGQEEKGVDRFSLSARPFSLHPAYRFSPPSPLPPHEY